MEAMWKLSNINFELKQFYFLWKKLFFYWNFEEKHLLTNNELYEMNFVINLKHFTFVENFINNYKKRWRRRRRRIFRLQIHFFVLFF